MLILSAISGRRSGVLCSDALNKPPRKVREEPVALGPNGSKLAVQFLQPSDAAFWCRVALELKLPKTAC